MILIVGASASGKSTIEHQLFLHGYDKIISYTTRPQRPHEVQHKEYHFISDDDFKRKSDNKFFAEWTKYNGWYYGCAVEDLQLNSLIVIDPFGHRQLRKLAEKNDISVISFLIEADEKTRLKRMVDRGDNLMEIFRRIFSDQGVFQGIENEIDYIINNDNDLSFAIIKILDILKAKEFYPNTLTKL